MTELALVVAADAQGGIGKDGRLPWRLKGDMAHFRETTTATADPVRRNAVVMGRRTWASIRQRFRPLAGRLNLVVTSRSDLDLPPGVLRAASIEEAIERAGAAPDVERCFAIGGARVYREALAHPDCRRVYLTRVEGVFECDVFMPALGPEWVCTARGERREEGGVGYRFEVWERAPAGSADQTKKSGNSEAPGDTA